MNRLSCLVACLFGATPAFAGITIETATATQKATLSVEGERIRVDQTGKTGLHSVLVDNTARTFTVLNSKAKTYRQMEKDRIATASAAERRHVEQALAKMPPVQRERVEEALRKSGQGGAGHAGGAIRFESMGKTGEVAGYPCQWHRAFQGNQPFAEACYIPYATLGATREALVPALNSLEFLRVLWARMGRDETPDPGWAEAPGFPGIRVPISPAGQRKEEERLVSFKQGPVASELLSVPADYTPVGQ